MEFEDRETKGGRQGRVKGRSRVINILDDVFVSYSDACIIALLPPSDRTQPCGWRCFYEVSLLAHFRSLICQTHKQSLRIPVPRKKMK